MKQSEKKDSKGKSNIKDETGPRGKEKDQKSQDFKMKTGNTDTSKTTKRK